MSNDQNEWKKTIDPNEWKNYEWDDEYYEEDVLDEAPF